MQRPRPIGLKLPSRHAIFSSFLPLPSLRKIPRRQKLMAAVLRDFERLAEIGADLRLGLDGREIALESHIEPRSELCERGQHRADELRAPRACAGRVMRGLDPRIHLLCEKFPCRVKPGNDDLMWSRPPCFISADSLTRPYLGPTFSTNANANSLAAPTTAASSKRPNRPGFT